MTLLSRIPTSGHVVIEASAGTGKTFTIERIVLDLILSHGATIDQILVVTFTEKAARELRRRIRGLLMQLQGRTEQEAATEEFPWTMTTERQTAVAAAVLQLDGAAISTIHAFCQRTLVENAFAQGRLFGQRSVDALDAFSDAFQDALRADFAREAGQRDLLRAWLELKHLAQLKQLLWKAAPEEKHAPPWDRAALRGAAQRLLSGGFTLRAAEELFLAGVPKRSLDPLLLKLEGLFRALAAGASGSDADLLLAVHRWATGPKEPTPWDVRRQLAYAKKPTRWTRELDEALADFEAAFCTLEAAVVQEFLPRVLDRVRRRKDELGLFDFDDMLKLVAEATVDAEAPLRRLLRQRYRHALIDEFQDTDKTQWAIFRHVFLSSAEGHRLFVVGDPKQAIYRFRGGDVETYLRACGEIRDAGGAHLSLATNYRSTAAMIEACNRVFQSEGGYFTGSIGYDTPVAPSHEPPLARFGDGRPCEPVRLMHVVGPEKADRERVKAVARRQAGREIQALLGDRPLFIEKRGETRRVQAGDITCLAATNREARELGDELRRAGIPFAFYKQLGLLATPEAEHIADVLDAVAEPRDRAACLRAWLTPFFGLQLSDLQATGDLDGDHPLVSRLFDWHELAEERLFAGLFARILDESGILRREIFRTDSERARTNYLHIFELLLEESERVRGTLDDVRRTLRGWREEAEQPQTHDRNLQRLESDVDAVQVMTIHMSKGLEADIVFVLGGYGSGDLDPIHVFHDSQGTRVQWLGPMPSSDDPDTPGPEEIFEREREEEEQRLLYVALTRARARLYLPYFGPPRPGDGVGLNPKGVLNVSGLYGPLHERLVSLLPTDGFDRVVVNLSPAPGPMSAATPEPVRLWQPPARTPDPHFDFGRLVHTRAGVQVTSYSRLKQRQEEREELELAHFTEELVPAPAPVEEAPGVETLRGGAGMGVYLHELLERVPWDVTRTARRFESWRQEPGVVSVLERSAELNGIEPEQARLAERLVFTALTTPVPLPDDARALDGFCHLKREIREMEFLYPFPENGHPALERIGDHEARWTVERGFIKGFVDLIFEHDGRSYFADWKSDRLPAWDAAALEDHVGREYPLQIRLYSLALVKLLDLRSREEFDARFGGLLYVFLRGVDPATSGREWIYRRRPTWDELVEWEADLRRGGVRPSDAAEA